MHKTKKNIKDNNKIIIKFISNNFSNIDKNIINKIITNEKNNPKSKEITLILIPSFFYSFFNNRNVLSKCSPDTKNAFLTALSDMFRLKYENVYKFYFYGELFPDIFLDRYIHKL